MSEICDGLVRKLKGKRGKRRKRKIGSLDSFFNFLRSSLLMKASARSCCWSMTMRDMATAAPSTVGLTVLTAYSTSRFPEKIRLAIA